MLARTGFKNLWIFPIVADTENGITYDTAKKIKLETSSLTLEVSQDNAKLFLSDTAKATVYSAVDKSGTLTVGVMSKKDQSVLTESKFMEGVNAYLDGTSEAGKKGFGMVFEASNIDGSSEFVSIYKASAGAPSEEYNTRADGTDTTLQDVPLSIQEPTFQFAATKTLGSTSGFGLSVNSADTTVDVDKWFDQVVTPDNITTLTGE